jgi:hypothetical protein
MACAARIPLILTLLIAGTEGVIPATVIAGVVSSLQRHYLSGCVFLLHTAENSDLSRYLPCSLQICKRERHLGKCICLMLKASHRSLYHTTVGSMYLYFQHILLLV